MRGALASCGTTVHVDTLTRRNGCTAARRCCLSACALSDSPGSDLVATSSILRHSVSAFGAGAGKGGDEEEDEDEDTDLCESREKGWNRAAAALELENGSSRGDLLSWSCATTRLGEIFCSIPLPICGGVKVFSVPPPDLSLWRSWLAGAVVAVVVACVLATSGAAAGVAGKKAGAEADRAYVLLVAAPGVGSLACGTWTTWGRGTVLGAKAHPISGGAFMLRVPPPRPPVLDASDFCSWRVDAADVAGGLGRRVELAFVERRAKALF